MATKKSPVDGKPDDDWKDTVVSFEYGGREYRERIRGRLVLNDMSLQEVKDRLNDIPGKFAFWKSLQVTVEREIEEAEEAYEIWHASKYQEIISNETKKLTETAIKNMIVLDNAVEYRELRSRIRELREIVDRIGVLTKAFDMQSWSLRSIATLAVSELGTIEAHGKRSLDEF